MKKTTSLFIYLSLLLVFSCQQKHTSISIVTSEKFINKYKQNHTAVLIDVRTPEEYHKGYIDGALNFDIHSKSFKNDVSNIDTTKTIFLYCRSGKRSNSAAHILNDLGFKKIYDLKGGYMAYKQEFK